MRDARFADVKSATIIQLCPVAPGFYEKRDDEPWEHSRTVAALALVELTIDIDGDAHTGRQVWPVICGYGDETDCLRVWTPGGDLIDIPYEMSALGDQGEASIGYLPRATSREASR